MTTNQCQQCQSSLPADAPSGICPQCLLGLGMQGVDSNSPTAAMSGSAYPAPSAEQLVNKFPNLEILHLIGQGGMGAVYQARQKNLDRLVALKILSPRLGNDPTFAERFTREARTLAKLSHPNIVTVFNFGQVDEMYYLVMEFVEGVNLRDTIQAKTLDPEKALAVVPLICDALQYAHDKGVVHRDIKPEHILVSVDGGVKIADFGLAKLLEPSADDFTLTNTRQVMGTLKYMAPEQIEKPEEVDHRADLFSLGVVFYELLTGELPIGRFSLPSEKAAINGQLDEVVMKTLEKEPDRRYQQASQIKTAVAQARQPASQPITPAYAKAGIPSKPDERPRLLAVPFTTADIHMGFGNVFGLATISDEALELEFEIRDSVGGSIKSAARTVEIPFDKLTNASYETGFFGHRIELQTETMSALSEIPTSQQGAVKLRIKKKDEVIARQLVELLRWEVGLADNHFGAISPSAPVKGKSVDSQTPTRVFSQPVRAALILLPLIAMSILFMLAITWFSARSPNTVTPPEASVETVVEEDQALDPSLWGPLDPAPANSVVQGATTDAQVQPPDEIAQAAAVTPLEYGADLKMGALFLIGLIVLPTFVLVIGIILWLILRANRNAATK